MPQSFSLSRRYLLWTQLSIFLVALFAFLNSLRNQFALDDLIHLLGDSKIRTLEAGLGALWTPMYPGNLYRPLITFSYAITYHFFGLNPLPYHLTNILLHALNSVLVFRLVLFCLPLRLAAFTAFIFAVHPLNCEVVANISGRSELFAFFFGINALLFCIALCRQNFEGDWARRFATFFSVFLSFVLALLSKESAISILILMPLVFACLTFDQTSFVRVSICYLTLVLGAEYYLYLRIGALGSILGNGSEVDFLDNPLINMSFAQRLPNALSGLGHYVTLILLPLNLSSDYSFAQIVPLGPDFELGAFLHVILLILLLSLAFLPGRFKRVSIFFLCWYLGAFIATSNLLFPIGTVFAERLSYLPSIGILAFCVINLEKFESNLMRNVLLVIFCSFCVLKTSIRNRDWYDNNTLHSRDILTSPLSAKSQLNYGVVLKNRGQSEDAEKFMREALKTYPNFSEAAYNLGLLELSRNNQAQAEEWFQKATKLNPHNSAALSVMGKLLLNRGESEAAFKNFSAILESDPNNFDGMLGLLALSINQKNFKSAELLYQKLKTEQPENQELKSLAKYFAK